MGKLFVAGKWDTWQYILAELFLLADDLHTLAMIYVMY